MQRRFGFLIASIALLVAGGSAWATPANIWHIPDNSGDLGGTHMRDPWIEISNNPASPTTVTIYEGIYKGNGSNQTGGTLFYKGQSQSVWNSVGLGFHTNTGTNQYWKASFSTAGIPANDPIQYYIYVTTDGAAGFNSTFIYAPAGFGDHGGQTIEGTVFSGSPSQNTAASSPFTIRNRPGWIFHANNRVNSGNDVEFWAKVGYIGDANNVATQWATNGGLYYTTDGTDPVVGASPGTAGNAATQVITFTYDHPENSNQNGGGQSIAGTAMWWQATVPNLLATPLGTTIKYKVGFWNPSNNEQKFGDYNAGDLGNYQGHIFSFSNGTVGDPVLTVNGVNGNYTTTHVFVDETKGDSIPFTINFAPGQANISAVELYTNLNRRDRAQLDANADGVEDGILLPSGDTVVAGDDSTYFKAYTMTLTGAGNYTFSLNATKTGAYRLTARWKVQGDPAWRYYTNIAAGRRDHAIVVSPVDARNINLYEADVLNLDSSGTQFAQRGTLEDMFDAPNAPHQGSANHWNLNYLKNLGCNWLWFQPIHPITQEAQLGHDPGSPYSVRNFFDVNPLMTTNCTSESQVNDPNVRTAARQAFAGLVSAANTAGVGIMLDAPFNHTAPDCEISSQGTSLFGNNPGAGAFLRDVEARVYSRDPDGVGSQPPNYAMRAFSSTSIAIAPDRGDFGKWSDVRDVFFGRYAALVDTNGDGGTPDDNGNYLNEQDWFDYSVGNEGSSGSGNGHFDGVTQNVWKYFANYSLYWLSQTGVPQGTDLATQTSHGIGGLRADFGQGLPPQLWEYIINKTRTRKWNFVFMAESLDGGAVTYRSNRHFDIENENIVFSLKSAGNASDYRNIFESKRNAYGQAPVLLNNMSHDEEAFADPWQAVVRYAVCSTVDGVPLIFPGQELGISTTVGYDRYEVNFGKNIADFKDFNSMQPAWNDTNFGNDQLYPVYAGIGLARLFSPALRSPNRYFLNDDGNSQAIFAVAKYETKNASPALSDVVFGFANTNRDASPSGNFHVNQDTDSNGVNDYGIKPGRMYNVKNIAAYTAQNPFRRNYWLWGSGRTGTDVLNNGIFIAMFKVPTTDAGWGEPWSDVGYMKNGVLVGANNGVFDWDDTNHNGQHDPGEASEPFTDRNGNGSHDPDTPYEAQYLKLYDVTAPTTASSPPAPPNNYHYALGTSVTLSWSPAAADSEGQVPSYKIIGSDGSVFYTSATSFLETGGMIGQNVTYTVYTVNPNDNSVTGVASNPANIKFIDPAADDDGDGMKNGDEDLAGTNPFDPSSIFAVMNVIRPDSSTVSVTWSSVAGKKYRLEYTSNLNASYTPIGTTLTASGPTLSEAVAASGPAFYHVVVVP
ncbi:MAG: hypothetical protein QOH39_3112 [Verrucomicrobiota bacterium]|jgi:hypothetical protein